MLKKSIESLSVEIKEVKYSQVEIENAINELPSQMDAGAARMDERISDIEDKFMENNEAEKKGD